MLNLSARFQAKFSLKCKNILSAQLKLMGQRYTRKIFQNNIVDVHIFNGRIFFNYTDF